ncbi:MAG: hypothetical protein OXE51_03355 [Gammaproteobacteria bacterium]|nr:hypothetical protein [Gammaproteobacteria bacterium]
MPTPPRRRKHDYNHKLEGVYGEFGADAGVQAFYVQAVLAPAQLRLISLISDIQGSERWSVRDLFQRDVDNSRVTQALLPYLQDSSKIKFFNPLTLTVLPMDANGTSVLQSMPKVIESVYEDEGNKWVSLERENHFRVRWIKESPQYAEIEWNDIRSRLVAIDGQHRLSALKRFLEDRGVSSYEDFMDWRIPVVIVSFRAKADRSDSPGVLEVVRSIFVYINTEAKEVNEARKILLSDESVNDVCTQELLERSHENDLKPRSERAPGCLPLLFYDWRGEETIRRAIHAPAAVKSVEELRDWFEWYILGKDFDPKQETAFGINPTHSLHSAFHDRKLSHADSKAVRALAKEDLLPAVAYLLENLVPYQSYVSHLRELETEYEHKEQSDLARHAFDELRFGTNHADASIKDEVANVLLEIKERIEKGKRKYLKGLLGLDIGMRGVMHAFGKLRQRFGNPNWREYSKWYTTSLNLVYEEGLLDLAASRGGKKFLLHIAKDHNETIINYRLEDAPRALGAYLELLVAAYGHPWPTSWGMRWPALGEICLDTLKNTVVRGYKKQVRPQLREEYPAGGKDLTKAVNKEANRLAGNQMRRFERKLETLTATTDA